ncbi:MAG: hypothetical protein ALECFALPRED_007831 [Alectoria fallacina]|uniref:Alpha-galactosidase n=1 Tax=Alectoria fallacina TaxID=1903189 RepID=A0A8H3J117_9LECA|nr:MAG: hypothetical protein ALECFALPRED_007831 [Alectoria fallacina]
MTRLCSFTRLATTAALLPLALRASAAGTSSYNGLALTPAMGWDNWNAFGCKISEELILTTAQKIVELGLRDLGYYYIILDDCWSNGRTSNGTLQANATKFPDGIPAVAEKIHDMGLGWGMYSSAGKYTCAQYAASLGVEKQDAQTFADWGVDYLKYDNCYNEGQEGTALVTYNRYKAMSDALNATGRPILYSMCNWGQDNPWDWAQTIANSWRMSGDVLPGFHCSVMNILNKAAPVLNKAQPGAWNDLDMLEVGNSGMTDDEYKTHFSMALAKSPLIMGTDVTMMTAETLSIYSNPAIIAINQDPLGVPVTRVWQSPAQPQNETYSVDAYTAGETSFWTGELMNGDYVVAFLNGGPTTTAMTATMNDVFIDLVTTGSNAPVPQLQQTYDVYDLWANRMSNATAQAIVTGNLTMETNSTNSTSEASANSTLPLQTYNATQLSYTDGLNANNTALFGVKVKTMAPMGTLSAMVPSHGVAVYRLRSQGSGSGMRKRDEL